MPTKAENPKPEIKDPVVSQRHNFYQGRPWLWAVGVVVLIFILMGALHAAFGGDMGRFERSRPAAFGAGQESTMVGGRRHHLGGFGAGSVNNANQTTGTVTAVNGTSFTVAGHGSSTNVQTSSSTQYQGGNTVKVNDTVIVFGTTTSGTLDATQVVINP